MKIFILYAYLAYKNLFPIKRGKTFIANILTKMFGTFILKTRENISLEIFINSTMDLSYYEKNNISNELIKEYIFKLKEGDNFVDVGANIGYYSILASKRVGDRGVIYSIEPSIREYTRLLNNIQLNKCGNIIPYNFALSNCSGEARLFISKGHTGMNKLMLDDSKNNGNRIKVPVFRLDQIIKTSYKIFLVKIDVEGAEFLVLQGMSDLLKAGNIKNLIIEITPKFLEEYNHGKNLVYELLDYYGYYPIIKSREWQYDEIFIRK